MPKYTKSQLAARAKAQRAYLDRLREGGKTEVRNLFAKPENHKAIKDLVNDSGLV